MKNLESGTYQNGVSLVIPVYNEEETLGVIIRTAKKADQIEEIIVVDDGSTDNSREIAKQEGAKVVAHSTNQGKGKALQSGVANSSGKYVLFMDADIRNIADVDTKAEKIYLNPKKLNLLTEPLINNKVDMVKASFSRYSGRVTELVAKPLIRMFFPEIKFNQPLAGEYGMTIKHLEEIKLEDGWGVDSGLLIDAFMQGLKVREVFIGYRDHPMKPLLELTDMSYQVASAILNRAIKYGRLDHNTKIPELDETESQSRSTV
jgi:glucosyl-3-phosphoglycerate synthase